MKNTLNYSWLIPLVETENFRNVLIIDSKNKENFIELSDTISNISGNLIIATDHIAPKDNSSIIQTNKNIREIITVLQLKKIKLDLLVINDNLENLYELLKNLVENDGLILINKKIKLNSINKIDVYCNKIFSTNDYNIFIIKKNNKHIRYYQEIDTRLENIENKIKNRVINTNVVGVGVLTYNHEKYILECLRGIFKQRGNFKINLLIIDDCSSDDTANIIEQFLKETKNKQIKVSFIKNDQNQGMIANFKVLIEYFKNTTYFTFCEGDDYWISPFRIEKLINHMQQNPSLSLCFNNFYLYNESKYLKKFEDQMEVTLDKRFYNSRDLIEKINFIGNFSCCFYDSYYLNKIDEDIYDLTVYDFLFNVIYANFGFIGNLYEYLSVYRYHDNSIWSSQKDVEKSLKMLKYINEYNLYTNFVYDPEYRKYQNILMNHNIPDNFIDVDIMIIDNIFPSELSQFTYQEITSYLNHFKNSVCISTGEFLTCFNDDNFDIEIQKYKIKYPLLHTKVMDYSDNKVRIYRPQLLYFIFFSTVKLNWRYISKKKVPFIFELYPGGGFFFDDPDCDYMLKKIMSSKYFRKVIVTQSIVKDYLLKKKLCKENQIEFIFGVVMPLNSIELKYNQKKNYIIDKPNLDIVFMAHKYTKFGIDKGYDIFIEVAKKLSDLHDNIFFHVVGGFNEEDIDVSNIYHRIKFYGNLTKEDFDKFFIDKDIIVSPNIPNVIAPGAFDGFPTASCTEAGLRKTSIFCTDCLSMNSNRYKIGTEIEIIDHNADNIVNKINYYYNHPKELKQLGNNGSIAIKKLYDYEHQIKPRIDILEKYIRKDL